MPDLTALTGTVPLPLWTAAAGLALLLAVVIVALRRAGSPGSIAALFGVPALLVIAWSAWTFSDRQRLAEREALNARGLQLAALSMAPGSALACLGGRAGEAVNASCEAAIFRTPETVAAAVVYVETELRLLADGLDYAKRADPNYSQTLHQFRTGIEADRYGFVAHVLTRDGCTVDSCGAFGGLLRDSELVKANMSAQKLEATIARYAGTWNGGSSAAAAGVAAIPAAPPAATTLSSVPVTNPIDYPTAASIPAVSIMTDPPKAAGAAASAGAAPDARRPPANAAPARPPAKPPAPANPAPRPQ